jgi:hypothetical protein
MFTTLNEQTGGGGGAGAPQCHGDLLAVRSVKRLSAR